LISAVKPKKAIEYMNILWYQHSVQGGYFITSEYRRLLPIEIKAKMVIIFKAFCPKNLKKALLSFENRPIIRIRDKNWSRIVPIERM